MLVLENVTKKIRKKYLADELSMHVPEGSLYALVGLPGSGKSSALKLAVGILSPDSGKIFIRGKDISLKENRNTVSRNVGYMGEKNGIYPHFTVSEYLEFYAHAHGLLGLSARERGMELLRMANLERRADILMESLPDSVLRQVEFLCTLIHRPSLLLLDDPFSRMDLKERMLTQNILTQLSAEGITIVITSVSLTEVLDFCTGIGVIKDGSLTAEGSREDLMRRIRESAPLYIEIGGEKEKMIALLREESAVSTFSYDNTYFMVRFSGSKEAECGFLKKIVEADIPVASFHRGQARTEDLNGIL